MAINFSKLTIVPIVLKATRIQHLQVPQYEGLAVGAMLIFIQEHREVFKYLPDQVEIQKCPKQWLINVIYTVVQDPFGVWVKQQIESRNQRVAVVKNLLIDMDPEVAEAFAASTAVSSKCPGLREAPQS